MIGKVTAEITDLLPVPITVTSIIDFGENSNVFGRILKAKTYYENKFKVNSSQIKFIEVEYVEKKYSSI